MLCHELTFDAKSLLGSGPVHESLFKLFDAVVPCGLVFKFADEILLFLRAQFDNVAVECHAIRSVEEVGVSKLAVIVIFRDQRVSYLAAALLAGQF